MANSTRWEVDICFDPLSLALLAASTAATVGGGIATRQNAQENANSAAMRNRQAALARNNVRDAYRQRTTEWGNQNEAEKQRLLAQQEQAPQQKQQEDLTAAREATATSVQRAPSPTEAPISGSAPSVVQGEITKRLMDAYAQSRAGAAASAKLGSYGDTWAKNAVDLTTVGRKIDTRNNFSRGDMALLGYDQDLAEAQVPQAKVKPNTWGEVLSGLGKLGSAAAGSGAFGGGGAAGASSFTPSTGNVGWANPMQRA